MRGEPSPIEGEAEEKMSDLFSLSLFPAFYPRSSSFDHLLLPSFRPLREPKERKRERLKGEKEGDGIKRRKKRWRERQKERKRKRGILVKNGQPAREDSLGLRRELRPCSGRDLSLSLYSPLRRTVSLKRCIKLRVHRESGNYWRCSPATYMCRMFLGDVQQRGN